MQQYLNIGVMRETMGPPTKKQKSISAQGAALIIQRFVRART
jgi:hypothetical protein